jgi:hypothetical protein
MKFAKTLVVVVALTLIGLGAYRCTRSNEQLGIITVPDYEHATYLCGDVIVINPGHEHDAELQELYKLAALKCPK